MAARRSTGNRDDSPRLPTLSLGLSSVRLIVHKLETEYTRVAASSALENGRELVKYNPNSVEGYDDYDDSPFDQSRGQVWNKFAVNLGVALSRCIPSVTFGNFGVLAVTTGLFAPRMISYLLVYPFCRLVFGTLYPAYASYKAVRTKNLKEYVKWMMYWIVFALFTCTETFTDVFLSWFPFYYEVKIVLVLWLLSPATKGSSILYRKFVHPALCRREQEIDEYIAKAKDQGYHTVLNLGTKGVNYATTVIMQTAIKGGGGLVQQLRRSYSLSDLTECEPRDERPGDEADDVLAEPRLVRRGGKSGYVTRRSASESSRSPMYFPEVDVDVRPRPRSDEPDFSHIKSSEDISSGYSSADNSGPLSRAGSLSARARARPARAALTAIKRPPAAEESEVIIEELQDGDNFEYSNMPPLINLPSPLFLSHTQPPFIYQYVGDQVKIVQILGNFPLNINSNNRNNDTDHWDQKEANSEEALLMKHTENITDFANLAQEEAVSKETSDTSNIPIVSHHKDNNDIQSYVDAIDIVETLSPIIDKEPVENVDATKTNVVAIVLDDHVETASLDTSLNDMESVESDDEASFGTPENSPKSKRKSPKGKYGKAKAPQPPIASKDVEITNENKEDFNKSDYADKIVEGTSLDNLVDIVNKLPNTTFKETGLFKGLQVVNPIAENKRRHKSKSPGRIPKGYNSGLVKLLQLPGKLAFWHRTDDKDKKDDVSTSSGDQSRRSSTVERADDFQSCTELNTIALNDSNISREEPHGAMTHQIRLQEPADIDNENISQDILEKSEALKKLIEATIENHPEYKFITVDEEVQTSSKSTDV